MTIQHEPPVSSPSNTTDQKSWRQLAEKEDRQPLINIFSNSLIRSFQTSDLGQGIQLPQNEQERRDIRNKLKQQFQKDPQLALEVQNAIGTQLNSVIDTLGRQNLQNSSLLNQGIDLTIRQTLQESLQIINSDDSVQTKADTIATLSSEGSQQHIVSETQTKLIDTAKQYFDETQKLQELSKSLSLANGWLTALTEK